VCHGGNNHLFEREQWNRQRREYQRTIKHLEEKLDSEATRTGELLLELYQEINSLNERCRQQAKYIRKLEETPA
jgi:chromosome segregation ATPase